MKHPQTVQAARAVSTDKKRLAEALATEIPPARRGPKAEGEMTVEQHLRDAAAEIEAETGEVYAWGTLDLYRRVALWVSVQTYGNFPWTAAGWQAHREAYEAGMSFADFAAAPAALTRNNGLFVTDPDRRAALIAQAEKDGVGVSKVLDVASNKRAVVAAIKADPALAAAVAGDVEAQVAIERAEDASESAARSRRVHKRTEALDDETKDGGGYGHQQAADVASQMRTWQGRPWEAQSLAYVARYLDGRQAEMTAEADAQALTPEMFG